MSSHNEQEWPRLGDGKCPTQDSEEGLGHIVPMEIYRAVYFALLALTAITVWAAAQPVGEMVHLVVAMTIATIKAAVVTLLFMHLIYESKIVWGIVIYPLFIFTLIISSTLGDAVVKHPPMPMSKIPVPMAGTEVHVK